MLIQYVIRVDKVTYFAESFAIVFLFFLRRVDAMAAPLSEKGVELERTLGYFQFNRDVDDEEVKRFHTSLARYLAQGSIVE